MPEDIQNLCISTMSINRDLQVEVATTNDSDACIHGSFGKSGIPYFGVFKIGSYYSGYCKRVPYFRKLTHEWMVRTGGWMDI